MGSCISSSQRESIDFISHVDIHQYFQTAFDSQISTDGFSTIRVFARIPEGSKLPLFDSIVKLTKQNLIKYHNMFPDKFANLTPGKETFLNNEISRSMAAHILFAYQNFSIYNPRVNLTTSYPIEKEYLIDWISRQNFSVSPDVKDYREVDTLEDEFCTAIYRGIKDYPFNNLFMVIFSKLSKTV
jgi:hypothetical protein